MKLRVGDILIFSIIIVASIFVAAFLNESGNTVVVEVDGELVASFDLNDNAEYIYEGKYTNVISVENGKAYVKKSDCPDKTCVHSGYVDSGKRVVCCLPNKMVLRIADSVGGPDVVAG